MTVSDDVASTGRTSIEPLSALGALAVKTNRIGLIATASTTYTEPFKAREGARSRTELILGEVRRKRPTLRQSLSTLAGARGHFVMAVDRSESQPWTTGCLSEAWIVE